MRVKGWSIGAGGAALAAVLTVAAPASAAEPLRLDTSRLGDLAGADVTRVAQSADLPGSGSPLNLAPAPRKTLQLDSNGRWGFRLDMAQPSSRDQDLRDVQAGAYLRFGPRFRVGGTVNLNGGTPGPQNFRPQDSGPRVRLESNFKF